MSRAHAAAFLNRELSWLDFNRRVLAEAQRADLPVLERLKFLAITAANLDEFTMVRVGGLHQVVRRGRAERGPDGLSAAQTLRQLRAEMGKFVGEQYALYAGTLFPELRGAGLSLLRWSELDVPQRQQLDDHFAEFILPQLTPVAVEAGEKPGEALAFIPGLRLGVICRLGTGAAARHVLIMLPGGLPRFVPVPVREGWGSVALEEVIANGLGAFFPGEEVGAVSPFRLTRNGDIPVSDDDVSDLAAEMEEMLHQRTESDVIRLEVPATIDRALLGFLRRATGVEAADVVRVPGPLDLGAFMAWTRLAGFEQLLPAPWPPQLPAGYDPEESIFDQIDRGDMLLHHPYESFDPVVRLAQEAADDPNVLAIKQFLYRTGSRSRIVDALIRAAENGKSVTVLVELRARFDEERNLERAEELRRAGAQIIYGVQGRKCHAKVCLVLRQSAGRLRRYVHLGTGNYNELTARLYTDISLLTSRDEIGADVSAFFNAVTARTSSLRLSRFAAAPYTLRRTILQLIESEASRAAEGYPARIWARFNSLQDPEIIEALCAASQAGVEIRLNVRGLCCLRPGVPGVSENIRIVSIIDRFLEHSRILYFENGGAPRVFISSADWMTRNLDKRVELLTPVTDKAHLTRLTGVLKTAFRDNTHAWELNADGEWKRLARGRKEALRSQEFFWKEARRAAQKSAPKSRRGFTPLRPASP